MADDQTPIDADFPAPDPPLVDESDVVDLLRAVLAWRAQGAASKWTTPSSLALVEVTDRLRGRYPALCSTLAVSRACGAPHPTAEDVRCARPAGHDGAHQTDEVVSPEEWR